MRYFLLFFLIKICLVADIEGCPWINDVMNSYEEHESKAFYWNPEQTPCRNWHLLGQGNCSVGIICYIRLKFNGTFCVGPYIEVEDEMGFAESVCGDFFFRNYRVDNNLRHVYLKFWAPEGYKSDGVSEYAFCKATCERPLDNTIPLTPFTQPDRIPSSSSYYFASDHDETLIERDTENYFIWPSKNVTTETEAFWDVFGVKNCTIGIKCTISKDDNGAGDCLETGTYVEVSDGVEGKVVFCGNTSFAVRTSDFILQDLFLKVNSPSKSGIKVKCSSKCDFNLVCGIQNKDDRIIGGEIARINEFPWQVTLAFKNTRVHWCGGAVINDRLVLTAKHCLTYYELDVLIHAHEMIDEDLSLSYEEIAKRPIDPTVLALDKAENTRRYRVIQSIAPTTLYNRLTSYDYDIALVVLDRKIDLADPGSPTPVCLPPAAEHATYNEVLVGQYLTATGWGRDESGKNSNFLRKVDLPFHPYEQCIEHFKGHEDKLPERIMCTSASAQVYGLAFETVLPLKTVRLNLDMLWKKNSSVGVKGVCSGDSRGFLVLEKKNGQFVQVGVTAAALNKECSIGELFTKTSYFAPWIQYYSHALDAKWCKEDL